ncbi:unnamed protein product [Amoebophrya sp. A25]|nr:unnamed protein product [Amoebophrya sp. A25]|eukprot:GSA25T00018913001.1
MLGRLLAALFTCEWKSFRPLCYSFEHFWLLLNAGIGSSISSILLLWLVIDLVVWALRSRNDNEMALFENTGFCTYFQMTTMPFTLGLNTANAQWANPSLPGEWRGYQYAGRLPWLAALEPLKAAGALQTFQAVDEYGSPAPFGLDVSAHVWFEYVLLAAWLLWFGHSLNTEFITQRWKDMRGNAGRLVAALILTLLEICCWLAIRNDRGFGLQLGYSRVQALPRVDDRVDLITHSDWDIPNVSIYTQRHEHRINQDALVADQFATTGQQHLVFCPPRAVREGRNVGSGSRGHTLGGSGASARGTPMPNAWSPGPNSTGNNARNQSTNQQGGPRIHTPSSIGSGGSAGGAGSGSRGSPIFARVSAAPNRPTGQQSVGGSRSVSGGNAAGNTLGGRPQGANDRETRRLRVLQHYEGQGAQDQSNGQHRQNAQSSGSPSGNGPAQGSMSTNNGAPEEQNVFGSATNFLSRTFNSVRNYGVGGDGAPWLAPTPTTYTSPRSPGDTVGMLGAWRLAAFVFICIRLVSVVCLIVAILRVKCENPDRQKKKALNTSKNSAATPAGATATPGGHQIGQASLFTQLGGQERGQVSPDPGMSNVELLHNGVARGKELAPVGLPNLGNTCHMNALLQLLIKAPDYWQIYLTATSTEAVAGAQNLPIKRHKDSVSKGEIGRAARIFFNSYLQTAAGGEKQGMPINVADLLYLSRVMMRGIKAGSGTQQDSCELLLCGPVCQAKVNQISTSRTFVKWAPFQDIRTEERALRFGERAMLKSGVQGSAKKRKSGEIDLPGLKWDSQQDLVEYSITDSVANVLSITPGQTTQSASAPPGLSQVSGLLWDPSEVASPALIDPASASFLTVHDLTLSSEVHYIEDKEMMDEVSRNTVDGGAETWQPPAGIMVSFAPYHTAEQKLADHERAECARKLFAMDHLKNYDLRWRSTDEAVGLDLAGFVVHQSEKSSLNEGHYTAFVRDGDANWWHTNDAQVAAVRPAFVGSNLHNGVLFYYEYTNSPMTKTKWANSDSGVPGASDLLSYPSSSHQDQHHVHGSQHHFLEPSGEQAPGGSLAAAESMKLFAKAKVGTGNAVDHVGGQPHPGLSLYYNMVQEDHEEHHGITKENNDNHAHARTSATSGDGRSMNNSGSSPLQEENIEEEMSPLLLIVEEEATSAVQHPGEASARV